MIAAMLLESALRALVLASLVAGGLWALRVRQVAARKVAWILVLAASLAMPLLMHRPAVLAARAGAALPPVAGVVLGRVSGFVASVDSLNVRPGLGVSPAGGSGLHGGAAVSTRNVLAGEPQAALPMKARAAGWKRWRAAAYGKSAVLFLWMAGSGLLLLRLLTGLGLAWRMWRRATPVSVLVEPRGTVRVSDAVKTPVTVGNGIVLPEEYARWERAKLRMVLAHERAHVRQGDFWLQLAAGVYCCVFWFSPVGWWVRRQLSELGEAVSDRAALDAGADSSSYAEVLLEFAGLSGAGAERRRMMAGVAMARSGSVRRRIELLLAEKQFARAFARGKRHTALVLMLVPGAAVPAAWVGAHGAPGTHGMAAAAGVVQAAAASTPVQTAAQNGASQAPVGPASAPQRVVGSEKPAPVPVAAPAPVVTVPEAPRSMVPVQVRGALTLAVPNRSLQALSLQALSLPDFSMAVPRVVVVPPGAVVPDVSLGNQVSPQDEKSDSQEAWAIVSGDSASVSGSGPVEFFGQAQKMKDKEHGSFVVFRRDGKMYVIDDPALVAQAGALFAHRGDMGLAQFDRAKIETALTAARVYLSREHMQVAVPTVDLSPAKVSLEAALKQLNELEKLPKTQQPDLKDLQSKLAQVQSVLAQVQVQARLREIQPQLDALQSHLNDRQSELRANMEALNAQRSRWAAENEQKIRALLDQALKDGKAKPVQ